VANDEQAGAAAQGAIGATVTLTRTLSEADLALFALVMGEVDVTTQAPPASPAAEQAETDEQRAEQAQQTAPLALLAALLTSVAAQHSDQPAQARFLEARLRFHAPAYAGETLQASATVTGVDDATQALRVAARCVTSDGRHLAEADLLVQRTTASAG